MTRDELIAKLQKIPSNANLFLEVADIGEGCDSFFPLHNAEIEETEQGIVLNLSSNDCLCSPR